MKISKIACASLIAFCTLNAVGETGAASPDTPATTAVSGESSTDSSAPRTDSTPTTSSGGTSTDSTSEQPAGGAAGASTGDSGTSSSSAEGASGAHSSDVSKEAEESADDSSPGTVSPENQGGHGTGGGSSTGADGAASEKPGMASDGDNPGSSGPAAGSPGGAVSEAGKESEESKPGDQSVDNGAQAQPGDQANNEEVVAENNTNANLNAPITGSETEVIKKASESVLALNEEISKTTDPVKKAELIQARATALDSVATAIAKNPANKLSTDQAQVLQAFGGTAKNEAFVKILTGSKEEIIAAVKEAVSSIEQSTKALNSSVSGEALKFSSGSAVNTRLAKLSNPYNADLALAYAISNLKDDALADGGNSINSVVKAYTDRFNFDHSVWANAIAANAKVDGVKPKMLGASFGYDSVFDNTILGGYLSIAKSKLSTKLVSQKGTNTQLGIYARSFVDNHEIDVKASFGFGKTKLDRSQNGSRQNSKFSSKSFSLEGEYGYLAQLIDGVILKPFVGLNYNYARTPSFKESGAMALEFGKTKHSGLNAKLGAELRLYTDGGSYAFIQPSLEREIAKSKDKISLRYVGSNRDIVLDGKAKKATYFGVQAGAEFGLTDNLSLNLGVGYKGKSKEQYYNASAGLRYKF